MPTVGDVLFAVKLSQVPDLGAWFVPPQVKNFKPVGVWLENIEVITNILWS